MIFNSRLPLPPVPSTDAFSYVFYQGRREYPKNRILYRVDGTGQILTFSELEKKSLQFADAIRRRYDLKPNDVVGILAKDKVGVYE